METPINWGVGDIVYEDPAGPVFQFGVHGEVNISVYEFPNAGRKTFWHRKNPDENATCR